MVLPEHKLCPVAAEHVYITTKVCMFYLMTPWSLGFSAFPVKHIVMQLNATSCSKEPRNIFTCIPMEDLMATKKTSPKAATAASKVLRNPKSTKAEKTAAASALSQREKK